MTNYFIKNDINIASSYNSHKLSTSLVIDNNINTRNISFNEALLIIDVPNKNSVQMILWYFTKTVFSCSSFFSRVKGYQMLLLALVTRGEMCQMLL